MAARVKRGYQLVPAIASDFMVPYLAIVRLMNVSGVKLVTPQPQSGKTYGRMMARRFTLWSMPKMMRQKRSKQLTN